MSWANFALAMKLGSMMGSVLGEATQNKYLKAASQAFAGFGTAASGAATMETLHSGATTANTTTPSGTPVQPGKHPVAPPPPVKPAPIKGGHPDHPWTGHLQKAQQTATQKAELLKVKPGGYTKESGLQESYLKGLEQSGAKLNNKGQIVKQSGQAFKTKGWDRKAQLMGGRRTPDRLHRLRMLAIDRANIGATDVKASPNTMNVSEPKTPRQDKLKPGATVPIEVKEFNPTSKPTSKPKPKSTKPKPTTSKTKSKTNPRLIKAGPNKGMYTSDVDPETGMEIYDENRYYIKWGDFKDR